MNYCKDCKYSDRAWYLPKCSNPRKVVESYDDPVKGPHEVVYEFCMHQRGDYSWMDTCGEEGKWFEPRPPSVIKTWMERLFPKRTP